MREPTRKHLEFGGKKTRKPFRVMFVILMMVGLFGLIGYLVDSKDKELPKAKRATPEAKRVERARKTEGRVRRISPNRYRVEVELRTIVEDRRRIFAEFEEAFREQSNIVPRFETLCLKLRDTLWGAASEAMNKGEIGRESLSRLRKLKAEQSLIERMTFESNNKFGAINRMIFESDERLQAIRVKISKLGISKSPVIEDLEAEITQQGIRAVELGKEMIEQRGRMDRAHSALEAAMKEAMPIIAQYGGL